MARYTGQCRNCGSAHSPKGNVFRVMSTLFFEIDYPHKSLDGIKSEDVKVCNNCHTPHPFYRRQSKQQAAREATLNWLLEKYGDD